MSLYRVVSDLGYRKQTDIVLGYLLRRLESCEPVSIAEPFLAASSCFEQRDSEQEMGKRCLASLPESIAAHLGDDFFSEQFALSFQPVRS